MTSPRKLARAHRDAGALHAYLPFAAVVGPTVLAGKNGELLSVLCVEGVDPECLEPAELEEVTRQFKAALQHLGADHRIYQYAIKRDRPPEGRHVYDHRILQMIEDDRIARPQRREAVSSTVDLYVAIVDEGWRPARFTKAPDGSAVNRPLDRLRRSLSFQAQASSNGRSLRESIDAFSRKVQTVAGQLAGTFRPQLLSARQAFTFLRGLTNYAPHKIANIGLRWPLYLDYQLADSSLDCHRDHLKLDDYATKVLTLKGLPRSTRAQLLRGVLDVPGEFILVSEWKRLDEGYVRGQLRSKARHFYNGRRSIGSFATSSSNSPQDHLIDAGADSTLSDLASCIAELETEGSHLGEFSMSIIAFNRDPQQLHRTVAEFYKIFGSREMALTEERHNLLNAWFAALPGNHRFNLRRMWMTNANSADLSLLFASRPGEARNRHLDAEALAVLETRQRTPFYLNLHCQDVAHTLVTGATGSGKSFLLSFLVTNLQKYKGRTCIFDLGGSYFDLTRLFGGTYVTVGVDARSFTINPFSLPPDPENLQALFQFVRVLIESAGYRMTSADERDLFEQIGNLYEVEPEQRRLLTLSNIVGRPLRNELQKWVKGGQYGDWFDNVEDNLTFATFQAFDFSGMNSVPQVLEPLLFYVLHRANVAINDPALAAIFKVFLMDEAWRFMRHPTTKAYMVEALKTWRKKNAAMILATQSGDDLLQSEMLSVVVENCPTKMFLANPGMDQAAYQSAFHLNTVEARAVAELVPKREFLLKQPDVAKVLNLDVDPLSYWIYTTNPYDVQKKHAAFERWGFEEGLKQLSQEEEIQPMRSNQ